MMLLGIGLMAAEDVWSVARQREREKELLFVGDQYREAIRRYYVGAPPGTARVLPPSVKVLLSDDRYPVPVRHLRRAYPDPITGKSEWGMVRVNDQILGVYSLSEKKPMKQAGFVPLHQAFKDAETYRQWVFAAAVPAARLVPNLLPDPIGPASTPMPSLPPIPSMPARRRVP